MKAQLQEALERNNELHDTWKLADSAHSELDAKLKEAEKQLNSKKAEY